MALTINKRHKFGWEITLALVIKVAAIYFLWWLFFSQPLDKELTGAQVGNTLFGNTRQETNAAAEQ